MSLQKKRQSEISGGEDKSDEEHEDLKHLRSAENEALARVIFAALLIVMCFFMFIYCLVAQQWFAASLCLLAIVVAAWAIKYWLERASALERVMNRETARCNQ